MIPALGAGGPEFDSPLSPFFFSTPPADYRKLELRKASMPDVGSHASHVRKATNVATMYIYGPDSGPDGRTGLLRGPGRG